MEASTASQNRELTRMWQELKAIDGGSITTTTTNKNTISPFMQTIDLPQIAVVGDTSAGKSSLLSQVTGIPLPCAHTLTTRCPTELTLLPMDSDTDDIDDDIAATSGTFNEKSTARIQIQWRSVAPRPTFDETLSEESWDQIPACILRAQELILQETTKNSSVATTEAVQVTVRSRSILHALSLVDLPGWVRSTTQHDAATLADDVEALIRNSYLQNPNCVVVAVLPANADIHNSRLTELIHISNSNNNTKNGTRRRRRAILPVLTKPDLIDPGAESAVVDLLTGATDLFDAAAFPHGWHMIKSRGQAAVESLSDALVSEATYFRTTPPWNTVNPAYLGTAQLVRKLGTMQVELLRDALPAVARDLRDQTQQARRNLEQLGGPPHTTSTEKRRYYQEISQTLLTELAARLSGKQQRQPPSPPHYNNSNSSNQTSNGQAKKGLPPPPPPSASGASALHEACRQFMDQIRQGSLAMMRTVTEGAHVLVTATGTSQTVRGEVVHLDDDFCCVDFVDAADRVANGMLFDMVGLQVSSNQVVSSSNNEDGTAGGATNTTTATTTTTTTTTLEKDDVWSDGSKVYIARDTHTFDALRKIPLAHVRTDPSWLRARIADNRTDDLPCFLNIDMFKNMVREFIDEDWKPYCFGLLDQTRAILDEAIRGALEASRTSSGDGSHNDDRYPHLLQHMERLCRSAATELMQSAHDQVQEHLQVEQEHPYTQDAALFERISAARHDRLRQDLRAVLRLDQAGVVYDTEGIATLVDGVLDRHARRAPDEYLAEEMEVILESYGQIATRRVVDRTPMICWHVVRTLTPQIQQALWSVTDETLQECTTEASSEYAATYQECANRLEELERALRVVDGL